MKYNIVLSDPLLITTGVQQDSKRGPFLFILEISITRIGIYADDSTAYTASKYVADINRSLTTNLKPLYEWINANHMVVCKSR